MEAVLETASLFAVQGEILSVVPFGKGHINSTWRVKTSDSAYLLQKINTQVFNQPHVLVKNRILLEAIEDKSILVEEVLTPKGENYVENESGFYRMQVYVEEAYAPDKVNSEEEAYEAAKGFGEFLNQTKPLSPQLFTESIPNFHHLEMRLLQLAEAVKNNRANRVSLCKKLLEQVNSFLWIKNEMKSLWEKGLPLRVCHNDTKIDNILLDDKSHRFKHVIDLDTVGPGTLIYDYGDMMRTFASPTEESEQELSNITFRKEIYEALHSGFMESAHSFMNDLERENLYFGGFYMTYIMAIRFLTDYLNGDIYYRTHFENENFIRARNQLKLMELMDA